MVVWHVSLPTGTTPRGLIDRHPGGLTCISVDRPGVASCRTKRSTSGARNPSPMPSGGCQANSTGAQLLRMRDAGCPNWGHPIPRFPVADCGVWRCRAKRHDARRTEREGFQTRRNTLWRGNHCRFGGADGWTCGLVDRVVCKGGNEPVVDVAVSGSFRVKAVLSLESEGFKAEKNVKGLDYTEALAERCCEQHVG